MLRHVARFAAGVALLTATTVAWAQDPAPSYSLDAYLALQAEADASVALWQSLDDTDPGFHDAAMQALEDREALLDYLAAWTWSGELPADMADSAFEARLVLLQNVVTLQTDLGDCDAAEETTGRVEQLAEEREHSELAADARTESWAAVGRCRVLARERAESAAVVPETVPDAVEPEVEAEIEVSEPGPDEPILAELVEAPTPAAEEEEARHGRVLPWLLMGAGTVVAAGGLGVALGPLATNNSDIQTWNDTHAPGDDTTEIDDIHQTAETQSMVASVLVGTGAAMATAGVLTLILSGRSEAPAVSAMVAPGGGHVTLGWRW